LKNSNVVLIDRHPGRSTQTIGVARELGTDPDLIQPGQLFTPPTPETGN